MSELSKQALKVDNNQSFPNNNAGLITPTALRGFNENMIDSTVNQAVYTADSASFDTRIDALSGSVAVNTGSLLVTASFNNSTRNMTFTKGDSSTFAVNIPDASGSVLPSGVISGSSQVDYPQISNISSGIVSGAAQIIPLLPSGTVSGSSQVVGILTSVNAFTASQLDINSGYNTFTQSADSRLDNIELTTQSLQSEVDNLQSVTGSYATTGSNTFIGNQVINGNLNLTGSLTASGLRYPTADNGAKSFIQTDGAGNLSLQYVESVYETIRNMSGVTLSKGTPVYISGSTGANGNAFIADASIASKMPAEYIVGETLSPGQTGLALVSGKIDGVNTTGFPAGTIIYVAEGGGFTSSRPSGSNSVVQVLGVVQKEGVGGQGIIINQLEAVLPNIQTGYAWVGNGGNQPVAVQTASLSSYIFTQNNTFTGTQTFNNIAVNGTGSFAYIESVTGSAKIIGDAFIILNNDTPTERYAGIIVIDSGSTLASASFLFDGQTNDWFYEYTSALDSDNFGVALFGPEYNVKGSPTYLTNNRLPKGNGGHHLNNSNISDDGSNVSINSNTQITGSLLVNGQAPLINSDIIALNNFTTSIQAEVDNLQSVTGSYATTGSNSFVGNQIITGSTTITGSLNITPLNAPNTFPAGGAAQFIIPFLSGSTNTFVKDTDNALFFSPAFNQLGVSSSAANSSITPGSTSLTNSSGNNTTLNTTRVSNRPAVGKLIGISGDPSLTGLFGATTTNPAIVLESGSAVGGEYYTPIEFQSSQSFSDGRVTITTPLVGLQGAEITGSVNIIGTITASLQEGFALVGGVGNISTLVPTSSFGGALPSGVVSGSGQITALGFVSSSITGSSLITASVNLNTITFTKGDASTFALTIDTGSGGGGGAAFPFTGDAVIVGSLGMSGSLFGGVIPLSITSNTASVDFSLGNMFTLTLAASATTHIIPTNIRQGQTCNIQITQPTPATGSVAFSPLVLFAGGADYQATATGSAVDMLTLVSFNGTNVLGTSIKNFL